MNTGWSEETIELVLGALGEDVPGVRSALGLPDEEWEEHYRNTEASLRAAGSWETCMSVFRRAHPELREAAFEKTLELAQTPDQVLALRNICGDDNWEQQKLCITKLANLVKDGKWFKM